MLSRLGPVLLLIVCLGASTLVFPGLVPLAGPPTLRPGVAASVDRGVAILARGDRPYEGVTFAESLKAYLPDRVSLGQGGVLLASAPARPVLIGQQHAPDYPALLSRAARDGLTWSSGIGGSEIVAFARDEAAFRTVVAKAGVSLASSELHTLSPMLQALHSPLAGATEDVDGWRLPRVSGDGLILFGPYIDLKPGPYRVRVHLRLHGTSAACRAAAFGYRPAVSITRDVGKGVIQAKAPTPATIAKDDPCSLSIVSGFTVPAGGAVKVETPIYGGPGLPTTVDSYTLEAASAQSR